MRELTVAIGKLVYSYTRFSWARKIVAKQCDQADKEHCESNRQYCHVGHIDNTICYATQVSELPDTHRLGLVIHEFGHMILQGPDMSGKGRFTEQDANDAGGHATGIKVYWKGEKTLEWARCPKWLLEIL